MQKAHFQIKIIFFAASLLGILLVPKLSIKLNPSPKTQELSVSFRYPSAGPDQVEAEVSVVLERALSQLDGLIEISSVSGDGFGSIQMTFDQKTVIEDARLIASTFIRQVFPDLPKEVSYPVLSYKSEFASNPTLMIYAALSNLKPFELSKLLDRTIILPLSGLEGVHSIEKTGLSTYEWRIILKDDLLALYELEYLEIKNTIANWSERQNLGLVTGPSSNELAGVLFSANYFDSRFKEKLENLPIKSIGNKVIYLHEIATVKRSKSKQQYIYRINGIESVNLLIKVDPNFNQIQLAKKIKEKLKDLQPNFKSEIDLVLETDYSIFLQKELKLILMRMGAAVGILFLLLFLIYRDFKRLWVIIYSFFVTLCLCMIIYYFANIEFHLYSLAGFTLSLGIILDNLIITAEQLRYTKNKSIFLALLAATLTTVGALSIIFFISPEYREQLTDFALIFFINLVTSLLVALFLLPALIKSSFRSFKRRSRRLVYLKIFYQQYANWSFRNKWLLIIFLILSFGLPLFLLPQNIKGESNWIRSYNKIMEGNYGKKVHPILTEYLGGTLRLFAKRQDKFYFDRQEKKETKLYLQAEMPFGGTKEQLNIIIKDFERFLGQFPQIKQFHSTVNSPFDASIEISFKEMNSNNNFPFELKAMLEQKARKTGSADFVIYGVGVAFNNSIQGDAIQFHLQLLGYNYDQLWTIADELQKQLLNYKRIQKVYINPNRSDFTPVAEFYKLNLNQDILNFDSLGGVQNILNYWVSSEQDQGVIGYAQEKANTVPIRLMHNDNIKSQRWQLQNSLQKIDSNHFVKPKYYTSLEKRSGSFDIVRLNQQYQLYIEYNFIGPLQLAEQINKDVIADMKAKLPPGYEIYNDRSNSWWKDATSELTLITGASLLLIFVISAILFNSITQALIPLILIPPAYVGIFLSTYLLDYRFDQGGFAALLLVAGLSVNAAIFIINDYNKIRKEKPFLSRPTTFVKGVQMKITPIILTSFSTILGLLPFLFFEKHEPFWYALAICTIIGLLFSILGLVVFLPMFFGNKRTLVSNKIHEV